MNRAASQALFEEQATYLDGVLLEMRKWRVFSRAFPLLDVGFEGANRTPFRVQLHCEDWNESPPSIRLLAVDGAVLTSLPTGPTGIFHQGPHPITGRPFVCMAGSQEYHTHSSHTSDLWDNYKTRAGYDLGGILTRIWNGWLKSTS
jgi:hypothetical protein